MTSLEPVDIDRDGTGDEFNKTLDESRDENPIDITTSNKDALKRDTMELVANQIYDKLTIMLKNDIIRFGIQRGTLIL